MRSFKEKEERMESALKRTGKEYEEVRRELEKCRYSIANLLDKCFEAGDADLIQFVEKYLELE
jgi:ferritin